MSHIYSAEFFDYIDIGARASAQRLIAVVQPWLRPCSVVDFGCGRGVWLDEWRRAGVQDICGLDGDYVDRRSLAIPEDSFRAVDLTKPQTLNRRFDLAQSLEVGEHLPEAAAAHLVEGLVRHSDRVLFSAAVKGQGGEFHIHEQPLRYWQGLFAEHGFAAFDCVRPRLRGDTGVEPWYRYNTILFANEAGQKGFPDAVAATIARHDLEDAGDLLWSMRKSVVRVLPRRVVTGIARLRAGMIAHRMRSG